MKIALSLPLLIREDPRVSRIDVSMLINCIKSLQGNDESLIVIYNQGSFFTNETLRVFLKDYEINFDVIGEGINVGIPIARQMCFEHVWENYPEIEYQAEIHLDMIFYKGWYKEVINFMKKNPDEPMVSPAIINAQGQNIIDSTKTYKIPYSVEECMRLLEYIKIDKVFEKLVHPAIHNATALKDIGGIDLRFFKGKQGYEDYSMLIAYYNYLGTSKKWKPKIYANSTVLHGVAQQRWTLDNVQEDIAINEEGLYQQYGAMGFKALAEMLNDEEIMGMLYKIRVEHFINTNYVFEFNSLINDSK